MRSTLSRTHGGCPVTEPVQLSQEVADALAEQRPVVALESTIFSNLGLPSPANAEALERSEAAVRAGGAVPAVTAVLDGVARVGLADNEVHRILGEAHKVAERDLGPALAARIDVGATTVSASLALAHAVGIQVFATGGIGGVHRDVAATGDISADLGALARHPVVTVCAGAKVFLDLRRTLVHLDTLGVAVVGWRTDTLPAFYGVSSGLAVPHRADDASRVAAAFVAQQSLGLTQGMLVTAPIPVDDAIDDAVLRSAVESALAAAEAEGLRGAAVTPRVLAGIAEATGGDTVAANLSLAEHNARVAGEISAALTVQLSG